MSKFDGIITKDDQSLAESVFSALHLGAKDIINVAETMENIIYLHPSFFSKMTYAEKLKSFITAATIIDTLTDEEINPLARKYFLKAFDCFNNNILYIHEGGMNNESICEIP